jgi:Immunity protein 15
MDLDPRFRADFEQLVRVEGLDRLDDLMVTSLFEEVPLYSRYAHVAFLDPLPVAERNRLLIRAAAWYLPVILAHAAASYAGRDHDYFCMLAVSSWDDFDGGGLVSPAFWYTNPSRGVLDQLRREPPTSPYSSFVADALDRDPLYRLSEGYSDLPGGPYLTRVYAEPSDQRRPAGDP